MVRLDMIKVRLGDDSGAWVCVLFFFDSPYIFVALDEEKLKKLRNILGFQNKLPYCSTLSLKEFEEYYPTHPVLSTVGNWRKMGIPVNNIEPEYF